MSRLEGLYEWSFNDGRVLGFFYTSQLWDKWSLKVWF